MLPVSTIITTRPPTQADAKLEVDLDRVATDLKYPIVTPVEGLIQKAGDKIIGLNDVALTLADAKRTDTGLEFKWQAFNPSDYPSALHVGPPPVLGDRWHLVWPL